MTIIDRDPGFEAEFEKPKAEVSLLALSAFIVSIIACIPIFPAIGVILGMTALVKLMGEPNVRGRGLAIAAIVLGLCFSIGWGVGGYFLIRQASAVRAFIENAPGDALQAGMSGDVAGFQAAFADSHPPEVAQSFLDELRARYGEYLSIEAVGAPSTAPPSDTTDRAVVPFRYTAQFDSGAVDMEVDLIFATATGGFGMSLEAITVRDRSRDALRYPPLPPPPRRDPTSPSAGGLEGSSSGAPREQDDP